MPGPNPTTLEIVQLIIDSVAAIGTAAAAGLAAWSAWISKDSAQAANAAVEEARLARKAQASPRLVFEREFLDFHFVWPHPASLNGEAVFLARKHWKDDDPTPPTFSLTNYGEGPGLELQVVFELEDPNEPYSLSNPFQQFGVSISEFPTMDGPSNKVLQFRQPEGAGSGLPLYRRWTTDIPNAAPGQKRTVDFPVHLLAVLFVRGLEYWDRRGTPEAIKDLVLTVLISCHTVEGDPYETQFRFKLTPFWQGIQNPLVVNGHCSELPMYPKTTAPRVL